jgi:uroporphyrinogen decarboxylase
MTSREIVTANIEFQCDQRIAFNFARVPGRINDFRSAGCEHGVERRRWREGDLEVYSDIWGNLWQRMPGGSESGEIHSPVIQNWSDLDTWELPDLGNPDYFAGARALATEDSEHFRYGHFWGIGWIFTIPQNARGLDRYLMDLIEHPDHVRELHERVAALLEAIIEQYGQAGLDGIMFGEDLGLQDRLMLGRARWNDVYRPYYERLTAKAHSYGMKVIQHSCGYNWELIDDLCDAGIDCLQFDQPLVYDLPALAQKLLKKGVGLFSPCDIQAVLPTGDRALIEAESKRLATTFRGGFIAKNYPDTAGIGITDEWDQWAYDAFVEAGVPGGGPSEGA